MREISQMTFNPNPDFLEIMDMLDKRLNDKGKNWRHVQKALKVLEYCLKDGSELVVTWAKANIYIIKTLREFQYIDDDGRDVGQVVRHSAKELTTLILDEEELRRQRAGRAAYIKKAFGDDDFLASDQQEESSGGGGRRHHHRAQRSDEEDTEYRLAIEASKHQEEEDRKKRESQRAGAAPEDDDLAKAIKLSREEEEFRRRELEESNAHSLFDDDPVQNPAMTNFTGYNGGYQQGGAVDWSANPIQQQATGFPANYNQTGFQNQYPNGYQNGFNAQPTGFDPYGQQQQGLQAQPTGYNPYASQTGFGQQQQPEPQPQMPMMTGTNNPWATNQQAAQPQMPMPTGSNNPFASSFNRPATSNGPRPQPTLGVLREQKSLSQFNNHPSLNPSTSFSASPQPAREQDPQHAKLNALLASGEGMDTFGNTGNLRIPAQHTAPGTFVNSAAHGLGRLNEQATGHNPFLNSQFTGMPQTSYGDGRQMPAATGPAGGYGQQNNNPFGQRQQPQNGGGDLIQF